MPPLEYEQPETQLPPGTKRCRCGPKPLSEFSKDRSRRDGLRVLCRECRKNTRRDRSQPAWSPPAWSPAGFTWDRDQRAKYSVLMAYGGRCVCPGCPENSDPHWEFLVVDRPDGSGRMHHRTESQQGKFYRSLIKNEFPPGFQVSCANCNEARGDLGTCPHLTGTWATPPAPPVACRGSQIASSVLREADVSDIKLRLAARESPASIARAYDVHPTTIRSIASGKSWRHVT